MPAAEIIAGAMMLYAVLGFAFACAFVIISAPKGVAFRLIILPGAVALWPLLLYRRLRAKGETP
jgi:hypothetical protein